MKSWRTGQERTNTVFWKQNSGESSTAHSMSWGMKLRYTKPREKRMLCRPLWTPTPSAVNLSLRKKQTKLTSPSPRASPTLLPLVVLSSIWAEKPRLHFWETVNHCVSNVHGWMSCLPASGGNWAGRKEGILHSNLVVAVLQPSVSSD